MKEFIEAFRLVFSQEGWRAVQAMLAGATIALVAGLLVFTAGKLIFKKESPDSFTAQMQRVSSALSDVNRISESLKGLKDDLQKTEDERARIEAEYKRVSEIKTMTEAQFLVIRDALSHRTIWQIIGDNLLAFLSGVVSSLAASAIWLYFHRPKKAKT